MNQKPKSAITADDLLNKLNRLGAGSKTLQELDMSGNPAIQIPEDTVEPAVKIYNRWLNHHIREMIEPKNRRKLLANTRQGRRALERFLEKNDVQVRRTHHEQTDAEWTLTKRNKEVSVLRISINHDKINDIAQQTDGDST
jgi:hypothetical protein